MRTVSYRPGPESGRAKQTGQAVWRAPCQFELRGLAGRSALPVPLSDASGPLRRPASRKPKRPSHIPFRAFGIWHLALIISYLFVFYLPFSIPCFRSQFPIFILRGENEGHREFLARGGQTGASAILMEMRDAPFSETQGDWFRGNRAEAVGIARRSTRGLRLAMRCTG